MGHESYHKEAQPLRWFASPLQEPASNDASSSRSDDGIYDKHYSLTVSSTHASDLEQGKPHNDKVELLRSLTSSSSRDMPAFHRHSEATTAELFYDLFFVANLTTFTSMLEINDGDSMRAYIGFFSLLWLTWYQVTLYDVRFAADCVFERLAKASHFGVMVGFAVIGPAWKPSDAIEDFKIYKAFGTMLVVSRFTLFLQYSSTLFFCSTAGYKKTVFPLLMVMGSTLLAVVLYGATAGTFPDLKIRIVGDEEEIVKQKSHVYIAWYVIALIETLLTVGVSTFWRVISFKGTHMVQRMSLLTLIVLGEGIIVICKAISKIVKNEAQWTGSIVAQIIAAILIIYFLYMSYFDRLHEEHFGSIKQQIWSILHFPLHIVLVLVLQGISILVIYRQAVETLHALDNSITFVQQHELNYTSPAAYGAALNSTVYATIFAKLPTAAEGIDYDTEMREIDEAVRAIVHNAPYVNITTVEGVKRVNETAKQGFDEAQNDLMAATITTLFSTLSVTLPDNRWAEPVGSHGFRNFDVIMTKYHDVFALVVVYVFVCGGLALIINALLGLLSMPSHRRYVSEVVRLGVNIVAGVSLCLVASVRYSSKNMSVWMCSPWMIPTMGIVMFVCVLVTHARWPRRWGR